ncbi:hypothetical protein [Paenibacillus sp. GP183]|uniref:hypothetical protein n=1 Tax=Paenibacillus sp. GP183 TaxID=1882751 RepID=UPI000896D5BD|nr:hypothetical protein [Paenibacillus sp. GP183]SEB93433.1 hypothetical protein SAMN05443246_2399 [Paenibacillus sp. GP183]
MEKEKDKTEKDKTYGVKVNPELFARVEQIYADSGYDTQKDWFESVINSYEIRQNRNGGKNTWFSGDLTAIERQMLRTLSLVHELINKASDEMVVISREFQQEKDENECLVQNMKNELEAVQGMLLKTDDEKKLEENQIQVLKKEINNLNEKSLGWQLALDEKDKEIRRLTVELENGRQQIDPAKVRNLEEQVRSLQSDLDKSQLIQQGSEKLLASEQEKIQVLKQLLIEKSEKFQKVPKKPRNKTEEKIEEQIEIPVV